MLVSHRYRFIYTKTKKTAGTSVESYFEPFCMAEGEWTPSHAREEHVSEAGIIGYRGGRPPSPCRWWNHMPAALIRRQVGGEVWQQYFKFCVVRNPYEKAVSAFYFRRGRKLGDNASLETAQTEFENWLETKGPPMDKNKYLIRGEFCLDDVVRYESLKEGMQRICDRLGVAWEPDRLPRFKAGIRPPGIAARDLYTERSREIVRRAYRFELDHFGYSFPGE